MDHASFTEICLHQLKMSGVHEGEKLVVLTQGADRLDYADAFMAAGQRLGARMYHMRLPAPCRPGAGTSASPASPRCPTRSEALKNCDMLIDCVFLLFSPRAVRHSGRRHAHPDGRRAARNSWPGCCRRRNCARRWRSRAKSSPRPR